MSLDEKQFNRLRKTLIDYRNSDRYAIDEECKAVAADFFRVHDRAIEVLGSEELANSWFQTPIQALGGESPIAHARTAEAWKELENVLDSIAQGKVNREKETE